MVYMYIRVCMHTQCVCGHDCAYVHVHVYCGTDLHNLCLMHCDTVVRVLGQLVQGTGGGSVDERVRGVEVGHQWSHCSLLTKCNTIVTPHAAPVR